jgi:hypothetical protein
MVEQRRLTTVVVDSDRDLIERITDLAAAVPQVEVVATTTDEHVAHTLVSRYKPDVIVVGRWVATDTRPADHRSAPPPLISGLEIAHRVRYVHPDAVSVLCAPGDELRIAARNVGVGLYVDSTELEGLWSQVLDVMRRRSAPPADA